MFGPESPATRPDMPVDMPDLIQVAIGRSVRVAAFPIHEYWSDIGTPPDLEEARRAVAKAGDDGS